MTIETAVSVAMLLLIALGIAEVLINFYFRERTKYEQRQVDASFHFNQNLDRWKQIDLPKEILFSNKEPVRFCTRNTGHASPCNGWPRQDCKGANADA